MGTQYNPNPNGDSTSGWTGLNTTLTVTGDGMRLRKTATGIGNATQQFTAGTAGRRTISRLQITRNNDDPLPQFLTFGRDGQETTLELGDAWATKGKTITLPPISTPASASGSVYVVFNSSDKFDITVRHVYVYAYGDSSVQTYPLGSTDAAWSVEVPDDSLTVKASWSSAPPGLVQQLTWKASSSSGAQTLDASLEPNRRRTWTYTGAGSVTAYLEVSNYSGDSYRVTKTFTVPSGVYQADYAYEADYLHLEVDGSSSQGAVIDRYSWDWGDGFTTPNQTVPYASHNYATPGTYFVQLTITNSMGQTSTRGKSVLVQSVPTTPVDFTVAADKLSVVFTSLTEGTTYGWDFGDGGTATTGQASHVYATSGAYTVVLTVDGESVSQVVTVSDDYAPLDLVDSMRLEVRQDPGEIVPWNRLPNPSGALGASGWTTPTSVYSGITSGPQGLRIQQAAGEAFSATTESVPVPVLPGRYVSGSFRLVQVDSPCYVRARVYILDANLAQVAATTITAYQNAAGTYWTGPVKVPSSGRYATLGLLIYGSAGPTFPPVGAGFTWREAMIASSLYASQVTNMPYTEAGTWADVLGPTHQIEIHRAELDVSTLTATVLDATLDPTVADTIRPGQDIRLRVATDRDGQRLWQPVYTGKLKAATATYAPSNLEDPVQVSEELVVNPTLKGSTDTYEVLSGGVALTATADGGKAVLTGYSTANTYAWGIALKLPVRSGRSYRVKLKARRVSGGYQDGLVIRFRAFNSLDQDYGSAVLFTRLLPTPTPGGGLIDWGTLVDSAAGVWRQNEFVIPAYAIPEGASTINMWLCPQGNGSTSPNGEYTFTDVEVTEEWTPPALPKLRKSTRITLTAYDAAAKLAQTEEARQVATLQELPALMEDSGVPVTVDGVGNTGPDPVLASYNPNGSLLDSIVAARDTQQGYAHVSRAGVLTLQTPQAVSTIPAAILDEAAYSTPDVGMDTEDVVNSLVVIWDRWDPTSGEAGETVETRYGPYEDLESIREWGLQRQEVTWVGQVENVPAIEAQAEALLAANNTPERRIHSLTIPIRYATDLTPARALLDLMDLVRGQHARTGLDQLLRVTEVHHTITARNGRTPATWLMEVGFGADGTVARPIAIPAPPVSNLTEGAWIPVTFGASWVDYNAAGGTYAPCAYQVTVQSNGKRRVHLRGLAKSTIARTASSTILTMPADLVPEYNAIYNQATSATTTSGASSAASTGAASAGTAHTHTIAHTHSIATVGTRVDITKAGVLQLTSSASLPLAANGWCSLEGISWEVA